MVVKPVRTVIPTRAEIHPTHKVIATSLLTTESEEPHQFNFTKADLFTCIHGEGMTQNHQFTGLYIPFQIQTPFLF